MSRVKTVRALFTAMFVLQMLMVIDSRNEMDDMSTGAAIIIAAKALMLFSSATFLGLTYHRWYLEKLAERALFEAQKKMRDDPLPVGYDRRVRNEPRPVETERRIQARWSRKA